MDTEPSPPRREFTGVTGAAALRNLKVAATTLRVLMTMNQLLWHVAHTRPRCEKKLAEYCGREGLMVTLPCYRSMHK